VLDARLPTPLSGYPVVGQLRRATQRVEVTVSSQSHHQRVVIVGAGFAGFHAARCLARLSKLTRGSAEGTEVAAHGQLLTLEAADRRPGLCGQRLRWLLVDLAPRVLPELDPRLSRIAHQVLTGRGAEIRTETSVKEATGDGVLLSDGEFVRTRSLVWCVGVRPDPLVEAAGRRPAPPDGPARPGPRLGRAAGVPRGRAGSRPGSGLRRRPCPGRPGLRPGGAAEEIVAWRMHVWHSLPVPTGTARPETSAGQRVVVAMMTIGRRLKPRSINSGLDPASVWVLHYVEAHAPLRVSELAKCMELDSSTVSRHIRNLEEGGYLSRTDDPDDRRATRVDLTERGRAVLDESMLARVAIVDAATADWSEADRQTLRTLMTRLAASIDRQATETRSR
jgi:DNA-binding MarR family transcriptional regulator